MHNILFILSLKNFMINSYFLFFNPYIYYSLFIFYAFYLFFRTLDFKFKLFLFFCILILLSSWGFMFDLDGIIMLTLINELVIIFYFIVNYTQTYKYSLRKKKIYEIGSFLSKFIMYFLIFYSLFYLNNTNIFLLSYYYNYYNYIYSIISNDFFILYRFFFIDFILVSIFLTLILTFFSIFFILIYFTIKAVKFGDKKKKISEILKKQSSFNQVKHISMVRIFKKKI